MDVEQIISTNSKRSRADEIGQGEKSLTSMDQ